MASKNEVITFVIGLAVLGAIIYYFFFARKTPQSNTPIQTTTSPLTTISSDVGGFVNDVKTGFSKVLSSGENVVSGLQKDIGWGEKQLGNTVGFITTGASQFGRTVENDASSFVHGVESVFGDVGSTLSSGLGGFVHGVESVPKEIGSGFKTFEGDAKSGVTAAMRGFENAFQNVVKNFQSLPKSLPPSTNIEKAVTHAPQEIISGAKTIGSDIQHGVESFVNGVRGLF
jgi:phage-related protein